MSTQPLLMYDPLLFLLIYLNHIRLYKTLSYRSHTLCFFTLLILTFIYIYVHFYVFIYYYYYHALGALYISFIKHFTIIIHMSRHGQKGSNGPSNWFTVLCIFWKYMSLQFKIYENDGLVWYWNISHCNISHKVNLVEWGTDGQASS